MELCTEQSTIYREKLRLFILENYLFSSDPELLDDQDSFIDKGIFDSTGILELIFFLESEFKIQVSDQDMIPENLDSVSKLLKYLDRKIST